MASASDDSQPHIPRILLAEDNSHDQFLLEEAFRSQHLGIEIENVTDGDHVTQRLLPDPAGSGALPYDLIVLDAHLPCVSAEEVLEGLMATAVPVAIPIVVLSSALSEAEKMRFTRLGAGAVMMKPLDFDEYLALARALYAMVRPPADPEPTHFVT